MYRCSREMPCEGCAVQFSVFRRRRACPECARAYCAACLRRGGGLCASCRVLCSRPLLRQAIAHLKPRDLQCFLQRQNVSTRGCVEKDELLDLCVLHVNSGAYRRRSGAGAAGSAGSGPGAAGVAGAFSALKGFTSNINELINNAFDLRPAQAAQPAPPPARSPMARDNGHCCNAAHAHPAEPRAPSPPRARPRAPQPYSSSGGSGPQPPPAPPPVASPDEPRVESADCFEVEDVQGWDCDWELVRRPAAPLPNDSEVLLTVDERSPSPPPVPARPPATQRAAAAPPTALAPEPVTPQRAASELDLRRAPDHDSDTASLKDEPTMDIDTSASVAWRVPKLEELESEAALETLSARQLKALLGSNRVSYRGALERGELLRRAGALWRDAAAARERGRQQELPLEECCKICMAAPLECVLLECGHVAACTRCAVQLAECPICRQYVVRAVRFFRS